MAFELAPSTYTDTLVKIPSGGWAYGQGDRNVKVPLGDRPEGVNTDPWTNVIASDANVEFINDLISMFPTSSVLFMGNMVFLWQRQIAVQFLKVDAIWARIEGNASDAEAGGTVDDELSRSLEGLDISDIQPLGHFMSIDEDPVAIWSEAAVKISMGYNTSSNADIVWKIIESIRNVLAKPTETYFQLVTVRVLNREIEAIATQVDIPRGGVFQNNTDELREENAKTSARIQFLCLLQSIIGGNREVTADAIYDRLYMEIVTPTFENTPEAQQLDINTSVLGERGNGPMSLVWQGPAYLVAQPPMLARSIFAGRIFTIAGALQAIAKYKPVGAIREQNIEQAHVRDQLAFDVFGHTIYSTIQPQIFSQTEISNWRNPHIGPLAIPFFNAAIVAWESMCLDMSRHIPQTRGGVEISDDNKSMLGGLVRTMQIVPCVYFADEQEFVEWKQGRSYKLSAMPRWNPRNYDLQFSWVPAELADSGTTLFASEDKKFLIFAEHSQTMEIP